MEHVLGRTISYEYGRNITQGKAKDPRNTARKQYSASVIRSAARSKHRRTA